MSPAARPCAAVLAMALAFASCSHAADNRVRAAPSRPGASQPERPSVEVRRPSAAPTVPRGLGELRGVTIGGVDSVRLADVAARLGLRYRPHDLNRAASIYGPGQRADLEADTRDITVNGLRVFLGSPVMFARGQLYISRSDFVDCLAPMMRPGLGVVVPPPPHVIVLDPGHGGSDPGGVNPRLHLMEKTFTLDVAQRLRLLLERAGYRVVMTRTTDRLPAPKKDDQDLRMRSLIANREHADLFLSIHFNVVVHDPQRTRGIEVYTFPPANVHATEWWSALRKNDPDLVTTPEPANRFDHWNVVFAAELQRTMLATLKTDDRGKKLGHLGVLRSLNCPGVLVEPGYVTNDAEARKLATPAYRQQIAVSLYQGIADYTALLERLRGTPRTGFATPRPYRASRTSS
ncbi:MAG TPA: N-acetylmuramoyl-L-alanine amidase [Opitutaceae bacterium]|nr:N-acetylmuramoyl-L-alanine amidase [Opitutaceae bacterium]